MVQDSHGVEYISKKVEDLIKDWKGGRSTMVSNLILSYVMLALMTFMGIMTGCTDGRSRAMQERLDGYIKATNHSFDTVNQRLEKLEWKRVKEQ